MTEPALAEIRQRTHRLIASRYPTVGVFDTVASREDAIAAMVVESFTDDSRTVAIRRLARMPEQDLVVDQAGASAILAAFLQADVRGGRFTGPELGAWYCSFEVATAVAETVYHSTRRLARSEAGFHQTIQMRELIAVVAGPFVDIRNDRSTRAER